MQEKKTPAIFQMRYTDEEKELMRNTFGKKDEVFKLLRKMLLLGYDTDAPIGQYIDLYMTIPTDSQTPEQVYLNLRARNLLIQHLELVLRELWMLSNANAGESPEQAFERMKRDSAK